MHRYTIRTQRPQESRKSEECVHRARNGSRIVAYSKSRVRAISLSTNTHRRTLREAMKRNAFIIAAASVLAACAVRSSGSPTPQSSKTGARAELSRAIDSMVNERQFRNAHWGVLI